MVSPSLSTVRRLEIVITRPAPAIKALLSPTSLLPRSTSDTELPTHTADLWEQELEVIYTYARDRIPMAMDSAASHSIYLSTFHSLSASNGATRGQVLVDRGRTWWKED